MEVIITRAGLKYTFLQDTNTKYSFYSKTSLNNETIIAWKSLNSWVQSRAMTTFPESRHNYPEQYFWSFGRWICLHSSPKGWYIDILSPRILDITTQCTHSYTGGHHAGESLPVKHWRFGLRQRRPFWKKISHFAIWERIAQVIFHNSYINWLNEGWKWFFHIANEKLSLMAYCSMCSGPLFRFQGSTLRVVRSSNPT